MQPKLSPEDLPSIADFKDSMVAFVDILGFDKRARSIASEADFFEVGKVLFAAQQTALGITNSDGDLQDFTLTAISDSIIVSVPYESPVCAVGLLHILQHIQYEFIATGLNTLVRGYVARGPIYHKNGLIFGSGYSNAYQGERLIGSAPRIVFSPDLIKDGLSKIANKDTAGLISAFDLLQEDESDGFYFVDFLRPNGIQSNIPKDQLFKEREVIKNFIDANLELYKGDYEVLPKYKWLKSYFKKSEAYY